MRRVFLLLLIIFCYECLFSQEGEIIYSNYGQGLSKHFDQNNAGEYLFFDFDEDGIDDFYLTGDWGYFSHYMNVSFMAMDVWSPGWEICFCERGDVLANVNNHYHWARGFYYLYDYSNNWPCTIALRREEEGNYYYGWIELNVAWNDNNPKKATVTMFQYAYCTVPNYPLRYGQTRFDWSIEDICSEHVLSVFPNPTYERIIIRGTRAVEISIYNIQGQLVKTFQNTNDVWLDGLSQGIYQLRIIDRDGCVFTEKVVKKG